MEDIKEGTLIRATHRPIDLIPAFLREAKRRGLNWEKIINDSHGQFAYHNGIGAAMDVDFNPRPDANYWLGSVGANGWTSEQDAAHNIGELIDLLNEDLPEGMYFGAHPGDGADYGYWMNPDEDFD